MGKNLKVQKTHLIGQSTFVKYDPSNYLKNYLLAIFPSARYVNFRPVANLINILWS